MPRRKRARSVVDSCQKTISESDKINRSLIGGPVKKLTLWIITLAFSGSLFGQSLVGTWQGTLAVPQAPGGQLRVVVKVSTTEADKLQAAFYSIDQTGQPFPASSFTVQGSSVKMAVLSLAGNLDGKLSADGNSIVGS